MKGKEDIETVENYLKEGKPSSPNFLKAEKAFGRIKSKIIDNTKPKSKKTKSKKEK